MPPRSAHSRRDGPSKAPKLTRSRRFVADANKSCWEYHAEKSDQGPAYRPKASIGHCSDSPTCSKAHDEDRGNRKKGSHTGEYITLGENARFQVVSR